MPEDAPISANLGGRDPEAPGNEGSLSTEGALDAFAALSQPTRLQVFRQLILEEPEGMRAGDLSRVLGIVPNTLSFHLSTLQKALLISSRRQGREVHYRVRLDTLRNLIHFLLDDCCSGNVAAAGQVLTEALGRSVVADGDPCRSSDILSAVECRAKD